MSRRRAHFLIDYRPGIGLGHLRRCEVLAKALFDLGWKCTFQIWGVQTDTLRYPHCIDTILHTAPEKRPDLPDPAAVDLLIVDLKTLPEFLCAPVQKLADAGVVTVGLDDCAVNNCFQIALYPGFFVPTRDREAISQQGRLLLSGWQHFLVPNVPPSISQRPPKRILVLTGGEDPSGRNAIWPEFFDRWADNHVSFTLVQGPRAQPYQLPEGCAEGRFTVAQSPTDLFDLMSTHDAAICVFGLSLFECIAARLPTVTIDSNTVLGEEGWAALAVEQVAFLAHDTASLQNGIQDMLNGVRPNKLDIVQLEMGGTATASALNDIFKR